MSEALVALLNTALGSDDVRALRCRTG